MECSAVEHARSLVRLGDFDGARDIVEQEIRRIEDDANTRELWHLRFIRAQVLDIRGHVEEALRYLEALPRPAPEDLESTAALKMYCAAYSGFIGRYHISHRLFSEAEAIARNARLLELLGKVHLARAFIFFRQKDYVSSDSLFRSVLDLSERVGGWYLRGHGLWGIGKNLMIQEHYMEALPWLQQSLSIFEKAEARISMATVWSELAICHLGLGDDKKAMELLRMAERTDREAGAVHSYQIDLADIGNIYLHRRDYFTAISYYQRALALAREIKDAVSIKKWTRNINLAYARIRQSVDEEYPNIA